MSLTHETVATTPDDPDYEVGSDEWNAAHVQSGAGVLGRTAGAGATQLLDGADVLAFAGAEAAGTAATLIADHVADSADPHEAAGYVTQTEGDARWTGTAHDHTGGAGAAIPEAGLDVANAPANRWLMSYDTSLGKMVWVTTTQYAASSLNLVAGTLNGGNLASIQTWNDGNYYDFSEVAAATPGFDLQITFQNVETFNLLRAQFQANEGTGTHKVEFALWNINTSAWDLLTSVRTTNGFVQIDLSVFDPTNYIDTGASDSVIVRLYHPLAGAAGHSDQLEWLVIEDSLVGGGGISDHGALTGLDDAGSHPATAISVSPTGSVSSTTVQAAIAEIDGDVTGHAANVSNPHAVTKTQVGLGNVTDDAQLKRAAADFATFTEKVTPVSADLLLLEDSAAAGAKKKVQIGNLPTGAGGGYSEIQEEGVAVTARSKLNFIGSAVTAVDNAGTAATDVTIATGATPDLLLTKRSATADQTVTAGYSAVVVGDYEIADTFVLECADTGVLEIT